MFCELEDLNYSVSNAILDKAEVCTDTMMGKSVDGFEPSDMFSFQAVSCKWVSRIYFSTLKNHEGVG